MPKVSVIMPTYNRVGIIRRAIDSVLNQSFKDFELIIVDDGSTDDTREMISKISDKRLITTSLATNKGSSAARNEGLSLAKGKLIAYLDTDNVWHNKFLEVMVSELKVPYLMAYCSQNLFLVSGSKLPGKVIGRRVRNVEYNPAKLTFENYIDLNSVVHTKEVLKNVGEFDESLNSFVDWDLFARIAIKFPFKVKHVEQVLCDYYYFLKATTETITNDYASDEAMLHSFKIRTRKGNRGKILKKIERELKSK